jgi:hypothetical protein
VLGLLHATNLLLLMVLHAADDTTGLPWAPKLLLSIFRCAQMTTDQNIECCSAMLTCLWVLCCFTGAWAVLLLCCQLSS